MQATRVAYYGYNHKNVDDDDDDVHAAHNYHLRVPACVCVCACVEEWGCVNAPNTPSVPRPTLSTLVNLA